MRASNSPVILIVATALASRSAALAQRAPAYATLQQGTPVTLQLDETINSATAHVGQRVAFEVTGDVLVANRLVIPAGSSALGTVALVQRRGWAGRFGKGTSQLDVHIDTVRLPSGQAVPLAVTPTDDGTGVGNGLGTESIATSLEPSPVAPHRLAAHRKDIMIPEGTILRAFVRRDTPIVQQTASVSQ